MMAGMFAGMAGARPSGAGAQNAPNPQMADDMKAILQTPNLIKAERGPDLTIDNQQVAVFIFHIDLPSLFSSPNFVTLVKDAQAQNPNSKTKPMTDDEIKSLGSQLATAFKGVQIAFSRFVGVTDKLPHGGSLDITGTVNPADFKDLKLPASPMSAIGRNAGGSSSSSAPSGPISFDFHAKIALSGIGQKVDVPVPAGAVPFNFGGSK